MKVLLLTIIKFYWAIIPASKRNTCLFKESCSNHVFKVTKDEGLIKGVKALIYRFKNCRPGYQVVEIEKEIFVISANNELYPEIEMRDTFFY